MRNILCRKNLLKAAGLIFVAAPFIIFTFFSPYLFGMKSYFIGRAYPYGLGPLYPSYSFFAGIFAIPFLIAGFFKTNSKFQRSLIFTLIFSVLFCFSGVIFNQLFKHIPIFSQMRGFNRMIIYFPILIGFIVGFGFDSLTSNNRPISWTRIKSLTLVVLYLAIVINLSRLLLYIFGKHVIQLLSSITNNTYHLNKISNYLNVG